MKKIILIILIILLIVLSILAGYFFIRLWQGLSPVIQAPPADIVDLIEKFNKAASSTDENFTLTQNKTGLPLTLPPGFSISVFASDLGKARDMTYGPAGNLLVSITDQGRVVALPDKNYDGAADQIITVIDGLNQPHGLAVYCQETCQLYIAETDQVAVYDYDEQTLKAINKRKIIDLPTGGSHYTRSIIFLPSFDHGQFLISVGSTCNVCQEEDGYRASILTAKADGSDLRVYAAGLRNSVFMAIHPVTGDVWATDMGRDWLGDDLPPDEINIIKDGGNYGWPICYGKNIHDREFDKNTYIRNPCSEPYEQPSYIDIPAHSAPLGLAFFGEEGWSEEYRYNLLVAYHGSWNRSEPAGYKIVRYKLDENGNYLGEEDFITGWLTEDNKVLGRPVDILIQPGGIIYISDDKAGVIYRLTKQDAENEIRVKINNPKFLNEVSSPLVIQGEIPGSWFFEAEFPVRLLDQEGLEIASGVAEAQDEWTGEQPVTFKINLEFSLPLTETGTLILEKSNPSGLPENYQQLSLLVKFEKTTTAGDCFVGGCSSQLCLENEAQGLISTCEWREEYACYRQATCERQDNGQCGWTLDDNLINCLEKARTEETILEEDLFL